MVEQKVYVEASNRKKSWNKIWPEWWNTSRVEKSRYSVEVSVPVLTVNLVFSYFFLWVALSWVMIFCKILELLNASRQSETIVSWKSGQIPWFRGSNHQFRPFRVLTAPVDYADRALKFVRWSWIFFHTYNSLWCSYLTVGFQFVIFDHQNHNICTDVV